MATAQAAIVTCEHCGKRNRVAVALIVMLTT